MDRIDAAHQRVSEALRALRDAWGIPGEPMSSRKQETLDEFNAAAAEFAEAYTEMALPTA
jgi:predicted outer membrane protein